MQEKGYKTLRKGRYSCTGNLYFVTASTNNRHPYFTEFRHAHAAVRGFTATAVLKDSQLLCWVLMPDHVHWLLQLGNDKTLSSLIRHMKAAATRNIRMVGVSEPIWQHGFYDHALRKEEDIHELARYIVANPIRAGLVNSVRHYSFWDAVWL